MSQNTKKATDNRTANKAFSNKNNGNVLKIIGRIQQNIQIGELGT